MADGAQKTRSGRRVRAPEKFEPQEDCEDDFSDRDVSDDDGGEASAQEYNSSDTESEDGSYDASFVTDGTVSDPEWTDSEANEFWSDDGTSEEGSEDESEVQPRPPRAKRARRTVVEDESVDE